MQPAPLYPSVLPPRREEQQHPVSGPSPPSALTLNHENFILHPPQQSSGKVTCESLLCVQGRNRRYLCSLVIGAPAKCCTSGPAVNKAAEAAEPERTAAGCSGDLQPRTGGKGWKKQNCHVHLGCPRLKHTHLPSSPPDSLLICRCILCARGAEAGTCHRHTLLQFLEPLFTKLPVRNLRAWAVISAWNSHPQRFMGSTEPDSQSLQALLKSDMT